MTAPASPSINAFRDGGIVDIDRGPMGLHINAAGQTYASGNSSLTDEIGLCNLVIRAADTAGNLAGGIYPAGQVTVEVANGSNQAITAAVLEMASTDAGNVHPSVITYSPASFSNIAAGGAATLLFSVTQGYKQYAILKLTYAAAPTLGQVTSIVEIDRGPAAVGNSIPA